MNRRKLLALVGLGGPFALLGRTARATRAPALVLQESPVAGFQFHAGEAVWPALRVGTPLRLEPEPGNRHDARAVAVYFGDTQLGYLPRDENVAVSQMLDRGERLHARIVRLSPGPDPWERVRVIVELAPQVDAGQMSRA